MLRHGQLYHTLLKNFNEDNNLTLNKIETNIPKIFKNYKVDKNNEFLFDEPEECYNQSDTAESLTSNDHNDMLLDLATHQTNISFDI